MKLLEKAEVLEAVGSEGSSNVELGNPWKNHCVEQSWIHRQLGARGGVGRGRLPRYDLDMWGFSAINFPDSFSTFNFSWIVAQNWKLICFTKDMFGAEIGKQVFESKKEGQFEFLGVLPVNPVAVNKSTARNLPCTMLKYLPWGVFSKYFIYVSIGWMSYMLVPLELFIKFQ